MPVKDAPGTREAPQGKAHRRLPIGAEVLPEGGAHFRVWAPRRKQVEAVFQGDSDRSIQFTPEPDGYFSALAPQARAGALYKLRLDGGRHLYPDPASRFQPEGPHGPSQVVDPRAFHWTDEQWGGVGPENQVLYEMHVGTFTKEGTWEAAARELPELAELGITCVEVMPVAEFPGQFGWGYDGVNLFAPTRLYGAPDDFRRFINRAHAVGIGVILDVVYNHLGPDGNYLKEFSTDYFSTRHKTDWGEALNYDGPNNGPVRELFIANARYWIEEYHLDGFRFDATQNIYDDSKDHILAAITRQARQAAGKRRIYLVAENESQETRIVRPEHKGGFGMDALWNDDFHHSALVALSGHSEAYYSDYCGRPQEFISSAKWGYLYQGQYYKWQKKRRGTPALDLPPTAFVNFIENHDQVANMARGPRAHHLASIAQYRAMVALMLLMPQTPMLFQGQEFAGSTPFFYFADHNPQLANLVRQGRADFLRQFPSAAGAEMQGWLPDPSDSRTFGRSKLDFAERQKHADIYQMYRDLLKLRRQEKAFRSRWPGGLDGAVLGHGSLVLRYFEPGGDDRIVIANLDGDQRLNPAPEPLLAPPVDRHWELIWSSEAPEYGGHGTPPPEGEENWRIPGHATIVLRPVPDTNPKKASVT